MSSHEYHCFLVWKMSGLVFWFGSCFYADTSIGCAGATGLKWRSTAWMDRWDGITMRPRGTQVAGSTELRAEQQGVHVQARARAPKEVEDDEATRRLVPVGLCEMSDDWVDAHECDNYDIQSIQTSPYMFARTHAVAAALVYDLRYFML